jgi:hypothetical protein
MFFSFLGSFTQAFQQSDVAWHCNFSDEQIPKQNLDTLVKGKNKVL